MSHVAKLFKNGRSQAVRLPAEFRFDGTEVHIRRNARTGEVVLSPRPSSWTGFFQLVDQGGVPAGFMCKRRDKSPGKRSLFK